MGQQCSSPTLGRASKDIDSQLENIELKISKAEESIRHYVQQASNDPVSKQRALQAMKRKKMLEQQRHDLIGAQFNVDNLADQQEQAKFTLKAVEAMKVGHDTLKKDQAKMDVRQVEEMLDATEDITDEMRAISESLARGSDQASLESELLELQQQYAPQLQAAPAVAQVAQRSWETEAMGRTRSSNSRKVDGRSDGFMEASLPPPPPPPAPPTRATAQQPQRHEDPRMDLRAATALSARMAPYAHLSMPSGMPPMQPAGFSRTAVMA